MKRIYFMLAVFASISFFSVSVASAVVPNPISLNTSKTRIIAGSVEAVLLENSANGATSTIVIVDEKGRKVKLEVKPETVIYDKEGKKIALNKIKKGDEVSVEYLETKEIIEKAVSIQLTPQ